jgi:hypothetical protein
MAAVALTLAMTQQAGAEELADWLYSNEAANAAGAATPEYIRDGIYVIVAYGHVPEEFLPALPPQDILLRALDGQNTLEVKFRMQKTGAGALSQITVKLFRWSDVGPQSTCFEQDSPTDEIGLRVCEDLAEMSFDHHPPLLACYYDSERRGLTADALYWYGAQPPAAVADPANYLKRSRNHPLTSVGAPRTDCPATIEEAKRIYTEHRGRLASLGVKEIAATIPLRSEREKQRQAEAEARGQRESEGKSVELDDGLPYDEPWAWMQPTRHALGALLLEQGRVEEAESVYRADLGLDATLSRACQHPENVWSLHGLHECLMRLGKRAEAGMIKTRLDVAVAWADVPIKSSCFCRLSVAA